MSEVQPIASYSVFYTDGGARGHGLGAGCGVHAYFHTGETTTKGIGARFTPAMNGYLTKRDQAQHVEIVSFLDHFEPLEASATNNAAELTGLIRALEWISQSPSLEKAWIYSDSQYVTKGINHWLKTWRKKDWVNKEGEEIANLELWRYVDSLFNEKLANRTIEVAWVRGHSDDLGNHYAHINAQRGTILSYKGYRQGDIDYYRVHPVSGYFKQTADFNRLLAKSTWYFHTHTSEDHYSLQGHRVYLLGRHGKEDTFLGKRKSDSSYAVVFLNKPDPVLESIINYQDQVTDDQSVRFIIGRLNKITESRPYSQIHEYNSLFLERRGQSLDLTDPEGVALTREHNPPKLAYKASNVLLNLWYCLDAHLANDLTQPVTYTEITDELYETQQLKSGKEKRKLRAEFDTSSKYLDLPVSFRWPHSDGSYELVERTLRLLFDMDLPARNPLAALGDFNPRVYVITYPYSGMLYQYECIIETDEGAAIFSSGHSNSYCLNFD